MRSTQSDTVRYQKCPTKWLTRHFSQRSQPAKARPTLASSIPGHNTSTLTKKTRLRLPHIPLFYSSLGLRTLLTHSPLPSESQCLNLLDRHIIVLLPCRPPVHTALLIGEPCYCPDVLGIQRRKEQRISEGPGVVPRRRGRTKRPGSSFLSVEAQNLKGQRRMKSLDITVRHFVGPTQC